MSTKTDQDVALDEKSNFFIFRPAGQVYHAGNGHRVLSTRTMLGVTTAGPALLAQASSPGNKVLRSGVSILPMHKGVRERVTAKRRPSRFTCGLRK